ncbi:MAG: carotenoid oxygenase family protein [Pseudomonadales bacterium]|nr:carotenoid oxygenase family protein [Pseudomonadales bacterium]
MATPFPDHPNLRGAYAPIHFEADAYDLIVEGEIPANLYGTFYRNGPNPQFAPIGQYHWFGGDGMLHAFHIHDGKVDYRNRWLRTVKFNREREAGRSLFNGLNPLESDPSVHGVETDGIANTNVVWHGGRLLALEEGHAPFEVNPDTLASVGAWKFHDKLRGPMTAHPKMDPETGEMLFFGYGIDGMLSNKMSYHAVNRNGELTRSVFFDAPYAAMVHDFIVTRDYVIFPIMPLTASLDRALAGKPAFAWEEDKPSMIGIMPRDGEPEDIRWFEGDPCYVFHPMNAWNDGATIYCDVSQYRAAPLFPRPDGSRVDPALAVAHLTRWTIDMSANTNSYRTEQLDDSPCEFGRLDERFAGLSYRYGYMLCGDRNMQGQGYTQIATVDHQTGNINKLDLGIGQLVSEAIFVAASEQAAEGEGYLLSVVHDGATDKSRLIILDAKNIGTGPLATAHLDHRVPLGFHGNWKPGDALTS